MSKIWFTSDQHYGHPNSIAHSERPFADIEEMNQGLILRHNELVSDDDTVYMVGDFSLAMRWVDSIAPQLKGKKKLIPGNHDWIHSCHSNAPKRFGNLLRRYESAGIEVLSEQVEVEIGGVKMLVCHLPYWEESAGDYEARYKDCRPQPGDEYALICGHVHSYWKLKRNNLCGMLMYNVGVDQHGYKPVLAEKVFEDINDYLIKEEAAESLEQMTTDQIGNNA
jgi:calcineurin-like phosphoesterase family protein